MIEHHAAVLVMQQFCTEKFVEHRFRLAIDPADELLTVPKRLAELGNIAHDTFHAAARLRTLFVVHEMDDCDFATPPSCIFLRAVLILENSCTAESKLANCTLPMFANLDSAAQEFSKINTALRELQEGGATKSQSSIS